MSVICERDLLAGVKLIQERANWGFGTEIKILVAVFDSAEEPPTDRWWLWLTHQK
jgi:hypothetical protein